MEEEFNLSKKARGYFDILPEEHKFYTEKDVKEFIKKLKYLLSQGTYGSYRIYRVIDILAGERLL